jgi:cytochrome c-type biogenesis protein CcmH/NrfG
VQRWSKLPLTLRLVIIITTALFFYLSARATIGAYFVYRANQAAQHNQMVESYKLQQKALVFNPLNANYHRTYALTNLSLATALSDKANLTPEEQAQLPHLIQQAVESAQTATKLKPHQALNWQVLGQIYANLIKIIPQADQEAIAAYLEAIKLEPENSELLFNLGKIFYQTGNYPEAQKLLTQVIELQPSSAQAYYHLANTYRQLDQPTPALSTYELLLQLLEPGTKDFQTAETELTQLRESL